jgi:multicomponent Na+:H+ antiporter subunit D
LIWWRNIPFFLVWTPLLFASITAAVKPKLARFLILLFPALGVVLAGVLTAKLVEAGGAFTYAMGAFGAPFGNELRAGALEALLATAFCLIMLLSLLGGWNRMNVQIPRQRLGLYCVMVMLLLSLSDFSCTLANILFFLASRM